MALGDERLDRFLTRFTRIRIFTKLYNGLTTQSGDEVTLVAVQLYRCVREVFFSDVIYACDGSRYRGFTHKLVTENAKDMAHVDAGVCGVNPSDNSQHHCSSVNPPQLGFHSEGFRQP